MGPRNPYIVVVVIAGLASACLLWVLAPDHAAGASAAILTFVTSAIAVIAKAERVELKVKEAGRKLDQAVGTIGEVREIVNGDRERAQAAVADLREALRAMRDRALASERELKAELKAQVEAARQGAAVPPGTEAAAPPGDMASGG